MNKAGEREEQPEQPQLWEEVCVLKVSLSLVLLFTGQESRGQERGGKRNTKEGQTQKEGSR